MQTKPGGQGGEWLAPRVFYILAFAAIAAVTWQVFKATGNLLSRPCLLAYLVLWMALGGGLMALWLRRLGAPPILAAFPVGFIGAGAVYSYGMWRGLTDGEQDLGVLMPLLAGIGIYGVSVMVTAVWPWRRRG